MNTNRRWFYYDTAKLIIAVMLVLLLLFVVPRSMLPSHSQTQAAAPAQPEIPQELRDGLPQGYGVLNTYAGEWVIRDANDQWLYVWNAGTQQWARYEPTPPTSAPPAPVATSSATAVPPATAVPTTPPTPVPPTATALPPAATATPEAALAPTGTPAPAQQPPAAGGECGALAPSRLEVGKSARVTSNLNLRSAPGIGDNLVRVSLVGTTLKVTGGPQCLPYAGGVYRWWQVEAPDGTQGWSAEATLNGGMYFLEPLP